MFGSALAILLSMVANDPILKLTLGVTAMPGITVPKYYAATVGIGTGVGAGIGAVSGYMHDGHFSWGSVESGATGGFAAGNFVWFATKPTESLVTSTFGEGAISQRAAGSITTFMGAGLGQFTADGMDHLRNPDEIGWNWSTAVKRDLVAGTWATAAYNIAPDGGITAGVPNNLPQYIGSQWLTNAWPGIPASFPGLMPALPKPVHMNITGESHE